MKKWIIYKYTSPKKKCYIGQTYTENRRKKDHRNKESDFTDTTSFARCIQRYGFENLEYEVIDTASSQVEADEKEVYWIQFYDSIKSGYNICLGGSVNTNTTYNDRVVEDIIFLLKNSNLRLRQIAEKFGVSLSLVCEIKNGNIRNSTPIVRPSHQSQKGSQNKQSKLSEDQVREIKDKLTAGAKRSDLQKEYGVSKTLIQLIATNQMWGHVEADYTYEKKKLNGNSKLNPEIVSKLKQDLRDGMYVRLVAEKYGISEATVNQIKSKKTWKEVE